MPAAAALTGRTQAALPASTCAVCGPSLQHHIQILAMVVWETPAPEDSWEHDCAGLRGSPGQGPRAFLPVQGEAKLLGDPQIHTHQPQPDLEHPLAGARVALDAASLAQTQVSTPVPRPWGGSAGLLRGFILVGVSRWCRSVGWMS